MIYDSHRDESWSFRKVSWPGFEELDDFDMFTEGTVELSALSDLRAAGSLAFAGKKPDKSRLVRIYYTFTDPAGQTNTSALGTFFLSMADPVHEGEMVSGTANLESTLRVALLAGYGRPYTVKEGTNAVAKAVEILESLKLKTNKPSSSFKLSRDVTYEATDSWLTIVNDLLARAGYASCWPDAYGTIQMAPYVEPEERAASWTFRDDERSIMLPQVGMTDNATEIKNVVCLTYQDEDVSIWAKSSNVDPASEASVSSRGYEISLSETVDELSGATSAAKLAELKSIARRRLVEQSSAIEYVSLGFPWVPLSPNDAIEVDYLTANLQWRGALTDMIVQVGGHAAVDGKARRFVRPGFLTKEEGGTW